MLKRVLVDMSCTILHHGHVRLLKKASDIGQVIVALTIDEEVFSEKGYWPELNYDQRKEILMAVRYVSDVIPSNWLITDDFILENKIDVLVHGDDNSNQLTQCKIIVFNRTQGVSSCDLREKSALIFSNLNGEIN